MIKYKLGDKVICINDFTYNSYNIYSFYQDKIYNVYFYHNEPYVSINNKPDEKGVYIHKSFAQNFKPYNPIIITKEEDYYTWLAERNKS